MTLSEALILGIVQGLTEFLPVSSSGHLILAREVLGFSPEGGLAFDALLQLSTAFAILIYFRSDLMALCSRNILDRASGESRLLQALAVATLPALILGVMLESYMEGVFRNAALVAFALIAGSLIMLVAERYANGTKAVPSRFGAFVIGCFQALALIPGMSRSGMTLSGGFFAGLSREAAARFAFLLGAPILLGSGGKKLLDVFSGESAGAGWGAILLGAAAAFVVGLAVIHYFLRFIRTRSLVPFIWYRLLLACAVLLLL